MTEFVIFFFSIIQCFFLLLFSPCFFFIVHLFAYDAYQDLPSFQLPGADSILLSIATASLIAQMLVETTHPKVSWAGHPGSSGQKAKKDLEGKTEVGKVQGTWSSK